MMRVSLQPSFVIHSRPYRDSSLLVELLTWRHGRVSALALGARRPRARAKGLLRLFVPLVISWSGKTELVRLTQVETAGLAHELSGRALLSGLYLNELLGRLLPRHDPHPGIYKAYQQALSDLQQNSETIEPTLRYFELALLRELGYGLQLDKEASNGRSVFAEQYYLFKPTQGLLLCESPNLHSDVFHGKNLLALHRGELCTSADLRTAKRLMRLALAPLLGPKPLASRNLF